MLNRNVYQLALHIRTIFENIAFDFGYMSDLCGLCKRASVQLFLEGRKRGYNIKLVACYGHVYNTYRNYIIDITATQFGKRSKVLTTKKNGNQIGNWEPIKDGITSLEELDKIIIWDTNIEDFELDCRYVKEYFDKLECKGEKNVLGNVQVS